MKKVLLILLMAGLAGGGFWFYRARAAEPAVPESARLQLAAVERGDIHLAIAATGRVVANLDVDIKAKASGEVLKLPFDISQEVKKGDLLMELDPVDEQRVVDKAQVSVSASTAKLAMAKQNLAIAEQKLGTDRLRAQANYDSAIARSERAKVKAERLKQSTAANATTIEEYDAAKTDALQAQAEVEIAKAQIEELKQEEAALDLRRNEVSLAEQQLKADQIALADARQRLADTRVISPIDGVVAARNIQIGTIISSGISNVGGGTTVLTLSDLSHVFVLASVDESDIGRVAVDQKVDITADAFPNRHFEGKVVRIATRGVSVSNVVTFEVKIEVDDSKKHLLRPEMTANVEIVVAEKKDVLTVPSDSIVRSKGKHSVTVKSEAGATEEREIKVGISDNTRTEITDGLKEGEKVVISSKAESKWRGGQPGQRPGMMPGMPGFGGGRPRG